MLALLLVAWGLLVGLGSSTRTIFFQNLTQWGPKAAGWIAAPKIDDDVVMVVEHHISQGALKALDTHARKQGWTAAAVSPARPARGKGSSGGEAKSAQQHLQVLPAALPTQLPHIGKGFAMAVWRLRRT